MANWFVDYSATNNGDGTTAAQATGSGLTGAFNTLAGQVFALGDKVWIRRVTVSISSPLVVTTTGVYYVGWPKIGDDLYSARPSSGTSNGWDSDSNLQLNYNTSSSTNLITVSGSSNKFYRLKPIISVTGNILTVSGNSNIFNTCYIGTTLSTFSTTGGVTISGVSNTFVNSTFDFSMASTSGPVQIMSTGNGTRLYNMTFNCSTAASTSPFLTVSASYCIINGISVTGTTFTSSTGMQGFIQVGGNYNRIVDVNFSLPSTVGSAYYTPMYITGSYNYVYNVNGGFGSTSASTVGCVVTVTGNSNTVYLYNFSPSVACPYGIYVTGVNNTISVNNCVFNSTTADVGFESGAANNKVLANNCKFTTNPIVQISTTLYQNVLYSNNHNQQSGLWKGLEALNGEVNTSAATRTGGEVFSLKFEPKVNLVNLPDQLPFGLYDSEQTFLSISAGARTVTIYGAYKFYSTSDPPMSSDVWIEMDYQKSDGTLDFATSFATAPLTADSSVWSDESGLTMFSITLSFTAGQTAVCPLRIYVRKWNGNACVYIDPKAVIT